MKTSTPDAEAVFVEAAAWVVRLHGPERSAGLEAGLRRWLAEHPDHRQAFEVATETWNSTNDIPRADDGRLREWIQSKPATGIVLAAAAGAAAVAVLVGVQGWLHAPEMQTKVGEQRTLRLEDGTQVSLNTDTQLVVEYDGKVRRVRLEKGEALFEVARDPHRPFVVAAGRRTIEALGTAFVVRRLDRQLAVTLVEGKVAVSSASVAATVLQPGQRLVFTAEDGASRLDRPSLEKVTAWRRGLVMLDDTPLSGAIAEMNRYSTVKLAIEQPQAAALEVSGIFRAGDSMRFARAVARTYGLVIVEQTDRIVLTGAGVN